MYTLKFLCLNVCLFAIKVCAINRSAVKRSMPFERELGHGLRGWCSTSFSAADDHDEHFFHRLRHHFIGRHMEPFVHGDPP